MCILARTGLHFYQLLRAHQQPIASASASDPKKRKGSIRSIEKAFNMGAREIVDSEIARMFYTGGCFFTLLEILIILVPLKVQVNF